MDSEEMIQKILELFEPIFRRQTRERFVAAALEGLLAKSGNYSYRVLPQDLVSEAFEFADAVMARLDREAKN